MLHVAWPQYGIIVTGHGKVEGFAPQKGSAFASTTILPKDMVQTPPTLEWYINPFRLYTIALVDVDAPATYAPYLHALMCNISMTNMTGDVIAPYTPPSPPLGDRAHRYMWLLYDQPDGPIDAPQVLDAMMMMTTVSPRGPVVIDNERRRRHPSPTNQVEDVVKRTQFNIDAFAKMHHLMLIDTVTVFVSAVEEPGKTSKNAAATAIVGNVTAKTPVRQQSKRNTYSPRSKNTTMPTITGSVGVGVTSASLPNMLPGATIDPRDAKVCRCTLHVGAQQPEWCLKEKAWGQRRYNADTGTTQSCYNPYAVCVARTRTSYPGNCTENYDYTTLPDAELRAYAYLHSGIRVPSPWSRAEQLDEIRTYVCRADPQHPLCQM